MSVVQAVSQAVSDVTTGVVDTAKTAISDSAKQIAKTPLDILEELLGSSSGGDTAGKAADEEKGQGQMAQAAIQQKLEQDVQYQQQQKVELHQKILQQSEGYYQQKKVMEEQERKQQEAMKEQQKFQIKQLEKQQKQNRQVQTALDASSAEKRVGAG